MSVEELAVTGNETFEELEALMDKIEAAGDQVISAEAAPGAAAATGETTQVQPAVTVETAKDVVPTVAAVAPATEPTPGADPKPAVLTRDGVHTIPYEVLEAARERARNAEQRVEQLSADAAKAPQLEQQLAALKQQAVDAGLDPAVMSGDLSEEDLAEISEEYPALGRTIIAMQRKLQAMGQTSSAGGGSSDTKPSAQHHNSGNAVEVALIAVPDLDGWRRTDPDRWDFALSVDNKLREDPAFKNQSMVQRFREVERRTKAAFGDTPAAAAPNPDDVTTKAAAALAAASSALPGSPSDLGSTVTHQADKATQIAAMDGNALLHSMEDMSDADIEALLSKHGI